MSAITRRFQKLENVAVDTVLADANEILCESFAGGMIFIPTGSSVTSLTFYAAFEKGGDYHALYDHDGDAVALTVAAGRAYPFPVATYGAFGLKLVSNADGVVNLNLIG